MSEDKQPTNVNDLITTNRANYVAFSSRSYDGIIAPYVQTISQLIAEVQQLRQRIAVIENGKKTPKPKK